MPIFNVSAFLLNYLQGDVKNVMLCLIQKLYSYEKMKGNIEKIIGILLSLIAFHFKIDVT